MKRIYLLLLFIAFTVAGNTSFAQTDVELKHSILSDTMYYFNPPKRGHIIQWVIKNNGPQPLVAATDTFILARAYTPNGGSNRQRLFLPSDIAVGDSVSWRDTIAFGSPLGTPTFNWCDTLFSFRNGTALNDTDPNNNTKCKTIPFVQDPLSVTNVVAENSVELYPNPASSKVTITYNQTGTANRASVSVKNLVGQTVLSQNIDSRSTGAKNVSLDVSGLSAGIYIAELDIDGVKTLSKFSVVK